MNVLEKILEEIENRVNFRKDLVRYEKKMGTITDVASNQGALEELAIVEKIIRSIMENKEKFEFDFTGVKEFDCQCGRHYVNTASDDWIPCSKRLPEEHDSAFAIYKDTHLWSESMFEKVSEPVNITYELEDGTRKTGTSHTLDGKWKVEKENGIVKRKVVAWKPLPEPYRAADDSKPDWKENMLNTFLAGH